MGSCWYQWLHDRLEIYQGDIHKEQIHQLGAIADVVLQLSSDMHSKNYKLFLDNLFCSVALLQKLKRKQIWGTGMLYVNRLIGAEQILKLDKNLNKNKRESSCVASANGITITKWFDNRCMLLKSLCARKEPQNLAKRWYKKKYI
ncbi:hypothetical protein ILUMI_18522 [Ignelater luminosus]|uniref:PiggyBac transposable element-derived protein domain-containing protein n=1 Tax=Ignelater luminosus TaxID=2038154 RepID=A0A8K0CMD3_IGNLU|nr:hypothetical protein ILUMI_18522 [Ignelater luminosus]